MSNRIRYAWGHSPFGDFIVAKAGEDLVAFEFPLRTNDAVDALRRRFPGSVIEEDAIGLKSTIAAFARFIDFPGCFPFGPNATR
jgi:hypothetical protein